VSIFSPEQQIERLEQAIIRIKRTQEAIRDGLRLAALNHCFMAEAAVSVVKDDLLGT